MKTKRRPARCIVTPNGWRCGRKASKRTGDIYVCREHSGLITMALIDDALWPQTRRMLAFSRWENVSQARALVDRLRAARTRVTVH